MIIRDGLNKRVTFNATDNIEQKIDKLMTMMGKLVTEDKLNHLNREYINLTEVGVKTEVIIKIGLGLIMHIGVFQHMTRTLEVGRGIILIPEVVMVAMHVVIRGMGKIIATTEGMVIEIKIMTGIGVGHLKDRIEVGEMIEV